MINYRVIVLSSKEPNNKFVGWLRPLEGSTNDMELLFYNNLSWKPIGGGGAYPAKITPLMDGVASVGVSKLYAREDHVHPSDTSKANKEDVYTKEEIIAINDGFLERFETIDEAIQAIQDGLKDYQPEIDNLKETKQDKLVSGTNIKTINNESILGAGNISLLTLEEAKKIFIPLTSIGAPNGVASLNESGVIPSDQLPSYVDDVVDVYATYDMDTGGSMSNIKLYKDAEHSNIISTGESGKIYINVTEGEPSYNFRWTGVEFAYISTGGVVIGEITGTAYDGKKGKDTTDKLNTHVLDYNNPHKVTKSQVGLENVDNTSDMDKPVSTATLELLDTKLDKVDIINSDSKIVRYSHISALYTGSHTGYVVIKVPITAPTPFFDLTLELFTSQKAENIKLYISGYSSTSTGTFTTLATNQIGGQYNLPVQCGWGSDNNLRVVLGTESYVWYNHVITADLTLGVNSQSQITESIEVSITKETDISSYTQLRESAYKLVDLQTFESRDIFTQDPDSFNMVPGQTRCFTTVLDSTTNPIGSGILYGTIWLTRPTDANFYHIVFKDHLTNTIYTRLWQGSLSTGSDPRLLPWKKITPIDVSGTADQFIKGDGSLDSTEYRPVLIDKSKTTNVISRRDFLYTIANTRGSTLTGILVIEIPLATSRIYEFEVNIGSYRYYHKPTSLFFHLYRDKNSTPNQYCVCTKVGPLSYEDIRVAEKTDGQNFCILIGNLDSTWHNELIRIPELVEIINYLDSGGINIEATAYITTDESVFSKIGNIPTNSYYDPSSPSSISLNGFSDTTEGIDSDISDNDSLNQAFKKLDITTKRNAVNNLVGCSEKCTVKGTSQYAYTQLMFNRPIVAGKYYTVTIESIDEVVDEDYDPAPGFTGILYDSNTSTSLSASGTFTKEKLSITFKATVSSKTAPCLLLYAGVAGSSTTGRTTTFNKVIVTEGTTPAHQWYPSYDDMVRKVIDRNLLRIFDLEQGHINTTNGVNTNVNYAVRTKNFIPINSTKLYAQAFYGKYYTPLIYYYDKDKGYLSYKTILNNSWSEALTVPENAKYIKLVIRRTIEEYIPNEEGNPTKDRVPLTPEYVMMDKYNRISISEEGYQTSWFMSDLDLYEIIDNKITSAKPNISVNLWGNQFTGTEDFIDKPLYIKGSTTATWSKGLTINRTGDTTTGGAFIGAYGSNTGIPSHMCLGWTYSQASMIINLYSKKVALGVNLNPTNDYYDENVNVIGNLCTTGNNLLKPTLSGTWETGLYVKVSNKNVPLVSLKGNNQIHGIFNFGPYISQNILLGNTSISSDLTVTGDLTTNKASSTEGFFETSDEKVKDFKENIEVDLEKLSKLSKKYFSFKRTPDKLNIGVSAQEIKEIYPEIVSESSSGILSVDYSKLSVIALAAIDKLYDRIVEIEKRLNNEY